MAAAMASLPGVHAWWADGHMLTAKIAYDHLSQVSQTAANALVAVLAQEYPQSPEFVTAAVWADDLKSLGVGQWYAASFLAASYMLVVWCWMCWHHHSGISRRSEPRVLLFC